MLDRDEQGLTIIGKAGTAQFSANRRAEESCARAAALASGFHRPEPVRSARARIAIRGHPQTADGSTAQLSGLPYQP